MADLPEKQPGPTPVECPADAEAAAGVPEGPSVAAAAAELAGQGGDDQPERELDVEERVPADPEADSQALIRVERLLLEHPLLQALAEREDVRNAAQRAALIAELAFEHDLGELRAEVAGLHPADIAYILEGLPLDERLVVWALARTSQDGEILLEVSGAVRDSLISSMDRRELVEALESLDTDEIADLAPDLPREVVEQVQKGLSPEERAQVRSAMSYPEDTVGARMDFDLVTVRDDVTLEVVLRYLRRFDELPDHTDQVFVVDRHESLLGSLPLDRLLINEPETTVEEVMRREMLTLDALDDISEAAQAFERYDLVSAAVVGPGNRLIGRLTVSEVVDVIREEGEAELFSQAGLREDEDLFAGIWASARNRWMWLALNLCTAFFASRVIGMFEGTIERVVALAALMPIVAGIGGNSGNQTMTLFIRTLAMGQVTRANAKRLALKEIGIAALNGLVWGGIAGLFAWWLYSDSENGMLLGATMMAAMMFNLLLGAVIGMAVPWVLHKMGRDPAMGSSVLLTFSTDSMGFFIFLGLASLLFRQ